MAITRLRRSNGSQVVRLPKAFAFPPGVRDVVIRQVGRSRVISPADAAWDDVFDAPGVDLGMRDQPPSQDRGA